MSENGEIDGAHLEDAHPMEPDHEACYRAISETRRAVRRTHLRRRPHDKDLLPADLSGAHVETLWPIRICLVPARH